ncbi:hypothetical protein K2173_010841 [Erythroxylum novogranatense]|uniref:Uncharacterized protein n=1 Tax=Erythroxylum novogranatense TaxID=1862640 RepID=A0AAV8SZT7_9ROSI|nr:hypothetical protein K2173_010841 [Erythroxylum novogranatense]
MARSLSLSLSKTFLTANVVTTTSVRSSARSVTFRSLSSVAPNPDLAGEDSTDPLLSKLEDVIHRIIVRRSAPGWLPFLPGHSYWVPPPRSASRSLGIAQLIEKLANPMSPEESLSTTTVRGWPSSDYFIKGFGSPFLSFFFCFVLGCCNITIRTERSDLLSFYGFFLGEF